MAERREEEGGGGAKRLASSILLHCGRAGQTQPGLRAFTYGACGHAALVTF